MRKKTFLLSMLLPLAALIAACSGQEDITTEQPPQLPETQLRPMTFRATDAAQTRAEDGYTPIKGEKYPIFLTAINTVDEVKSFNTPELPYFYHLWWNGNNYLADGYYMPKSGTVQFVGIITQTAFDRTRKALKDTYSVKLSASGNVMEADLTHGIDGKDNVMFSVTKNENCSEVEETELKFQHAMSRYEIYKTKETGNRTIRVTKATIKGDTRKCPWLRPNQTI